MNQIVAPMQARRGYNTFVASKQNKWKPDLIRWAFAISVGAIAYFAAQPYGDSAPLGAPLPEVPVLIDYEGVEFKDSAVMEGRLNERLLELMAPQSDGLPPLIRPYTSESAGFTIGHPYGTEVIVFGPDDFFRDGVLSQARIQYGLPIKAIKYGVPEKKEGDKVTVFVSRLRRELESLGANFLSSQGVLELADYRFETLEYELVDESGEQQSHFLFVGPFGRRALVVDFITVVGQYALAKPFVDKIIRSFEPGEDLLGLLDEISQAESVNSGEGTEDNRGSGDD